MTFLSLLWEQVSYNLWNFHFNMTSNLGFKTDCSLHNFLIFSSIKYFNYKSNQTWFRRLIFFKLVKLLWNGGKVLLSDMSPVVLMVHISPLYLDPEVSLTSHFRALSCEFTASSQHKSCKTFSHSSIILSPAWKLVWFIYCLSCYLLSLFWYLTL